jgi:transcriptional regulator with XRE-family HTH domain
VVSERLRERRRDLGLTQKEVVSRLRRMGVTTTNKALSSLEHGAGLDVAKLPELAVRAGVHADLAGGPHRLARSLAARREHWPRNPQPSPSERATLNGTPPILGPVDF